MKQKNNPSSTSSSIIRKTETVLIQELHQLLAWTQKNDPGSFQSLSYYDETYADRFVPFASVSTLYTFGHDWSAAQKGRLYASCTSHFRRHEVRKAGLQSMPRVYRGFLCRNIYWDIDIKNAHPAILLSLLLKLQMDIDNTEARGNVEKAPVKPASQSERLLLQSRISWRPSSDSNHK